MLSHRGSTAMKGNLLEINILVRYLKRISISII